MKINNTVIRNSNFQFDSNDKCKISNNGAIFQILSSKLYSDKFNSIVREISSNMYDSHKAANKLDVPFVININHEYIEFKDFGIGLSEEEIDQIYKVYFNSTKSGDNNYIGGFVDSYYSSAAYELYSSLNALAGIARIVVFAVFIILAIVKKETATADADAPKE